MSKIFSLELSLADFTYRSWKILIYNQIIQQHTGAENKIKMKKVSAATYLQHIRNISNIIYSINVSVNAQQHQCV